MRLKPVGVRKLQGGRGGKGRKGAEWGLLQEGSELEKWQESVHTEGAGSGVQGRVVVWRDRDTSGRFREKKPYRCCYESLYFTQTVCYGLNVCASSSSSGKILRPKVILSGGRAFQDWLAEPSVIIDEIRVLVERSWRNHASFLLRKAQQRNLMHRSKTGQYLPISMATMPLFYKPPK